VSVAEILQPVATHLVTGLISAADKKPEDDDVVAGGWGALVFVLLILAVVVLAFSFTKQLRKAQAAKDAGVYGDVADDDAARSAENPSDAGQQSAP
jgi:hypothetical protein